MKHMRKYNKSKTFTFVIITNSFNQNPNYENKN